MSEGMQIDPFTLLPVEADDTAHDAPASRGQEQEALRTLAMAQSDAGQQLMHEIEVLLGGRILDLVEADPHAQTLLGLMRRLDAKAANALNAIDSLITRQLKNWKAAGRGNIGPGHGTAP